MTQDIIFNDALDASIKLNSNFVELSPGDSFEFKATVTGLSCSDVTYSVDNSEYVTLTTSGKKGIVTMNKDAKNFGEFTIKLTARAVSAPISDVATISMSEPPLVPIYPGIKHDREFNLFQDLYEKIIIKDPDKEPIKHINEGCYSTY